MSGRFLFGCLGLMPVPAMADFAEWSAPDDREMAAVQASFGEMIAEAGRAGASTTIMVARVDLDGDGDADVLARIESGFICSGAWGCPVGVYVNEGGGLSYLTFVNADLVSVAAGSTNGMRDLELGSLSGTTSVRWDGSEYRP